MLAVEVADLVKRYRGAGHNAVDDISFDVAAGQLFCLLAARAEAHHHLQAGGAAGEQCELGSAW